jgi:anti-anti-sigma regulatory factor
LSPPIVLACASAQDDSRVLICDLEGLRFIDLVGLRVLLDAAEIPRLV